jgi:hypothetical protein
MMKTILLAQGNGNIVLTVLAIIAGIFVIVF